MTKLHLALLLVVTPAVAAAQENTRAPIIDMHLHGGYKVGAFGTEPDGAPMRRPCLPQPCVNHAAQVQKAEDILPMTLEAMKRHNIVLGIVSDQPPQILEWDKADPDRFMLGFNMHHPSEIGIPRLRELFRSGEFQVLGELGFQYRNVAIDDSLLDPMFAMAAEMDIPVHIHLAGAGAGPTFPIHLGNPLRLSTVLQKHQNLRIYVENASWPFLEEITSVMYKYPNLYADLSTITWIIPRRTFHQYLQGLVENGLSKRLMFGSDQMMWPETIALAIEAIETADFLTEEQKRDIFYNNAARFLRLSEEEIAQHHGK